jgi:hypothetical protein
MKPMYRNCAALCIALSIAPQISYAESSKNGNIQASDIFSAINITPSPSSMNAQEVRKTLQSTIETLQKIASKEKIEDARSLLPADDTEALSPQLHHELSKSKFELTSDSTVRIHTSAGAIQVEAKDFAQGKFVLNGIPLNILDFTTQQELQKAIHGILSSALHTSTSHASWELIPSAHAVVVESLVASTLVFVFLTEAYHISRYVSCPSFEDLEKFRKTVLVCENDKNLIRRDPSAFATSESKKLIDHIKAARYLSINPSNKTIEVDKLQTVVEKNKYRTPWTLFIKKKDCGARRPNTFDTDASDMHSIAEKLATCLNQLNALARQNTNAQAQSTSKNKPQDSNAFEAAAGNAAEPVKNNSAQ